MKAFGFCTRKYFFWKSQKFGEGKFGEGYEMTKGREKKMINLPFWFNCIAFSHKSNFTKDKRNLKSSDGYANFYNFFDSKTKQIIKEIWKIN